MKAGQITTILVLIGTIVGGTIAFENRFAKKTEIAELNSQIAALTAAITLLAQDIPKGDTLTEIKAAIFTKTELMGDLQERSSMYRAFSDAGLIDAGQIERWADVRQKITLMSGEINTLRQQCGTACI